MSKRTRQAFEQIKEGREPTLIDGIRDAAASLIDVGGKVWDEAAPFVNHGKSELAAALFAGHAHVMYMRQEGGPAPDEKQSNEMTEDQRDLGRDM